MGRPVVWHRELLHVEPVHREDLLNWQRCLFPNGRLLMTSATVSFLLGAGNYVILEISYYVVKKLTKFVCVTAWNWVSSSNMEVVCTVDRLQNVVAQSCVTFISYTGNRILWRRAVLTLYRIQATEHCGPELYCLYTAYMLQKFVAKSCIAFIPHTGYRTLWHRTVLPLHRIQATQHCGTERYCPYTVYRLENVVAQSCIAFIPYTGYRTLWHRAVFLLYRIHATERCGTELYCLYNV